MEFFARYFGVLLDKWLIPLVIALLGVVGPFLYSQFKEKGQPEKTEIKIIKYVAVAFLILILVTTLILTLVDGDKPSGPDINHDVSIDDDTPTSVSIDDAPKSVSRTHGFATMYDDKRIPFWYESDGADVNFSCWIDNNGTSYTSIETAKLIIDDYTPLTTEDILIIDTLPDRIHESIPDIVEVFVDLSDLPSGRSEYDITFSNYIDGSTGNSTSLQGNNSFYIDSTSKMGICTKIHLNSTGLYTYHFEIGMSYYQEEKLFKTEPKSIIYIEGAYKDYKYNRTKLNTLFIDKEYRKDNLNEVMFYNIEGRTLRIHDTKTVLLCNDFWNFYNLINNIIIEDGAEEIKRDAYSRFPPFNINAIYLPKTLKSFFPGDLFYPGGLSVKIY